MSPKAAFWRDIAFVGALVVTGCKVDEDLPSRAAPPPASDATAPDAGAPGKCDSGATQECHVTIGKEAGVLTCLVGQRTCTSGTWGPCEGTISSQPAPAEEQGSESGSTDFPKPLSLTDAGPCINDPCDPTCQIFNEVPDGGVKAPLGDGGSYQGGSITSIPAGFIGKGIKEPCGEALDCQFDEYCSAPVSGTCAHSKCTTGAPLASGCDSCVTSICAASPECCSGSNGTCSHSTCATGAALTSGCNSCATTVCAADPSCCTVSSGTCSHSKCSTGAALTTGCDSCVTSICASNPSCCTATFGGTCAHSACTTGKKLAASCDTCVAAICAAKPSCCNGSGNAWDASCVAMVASTAACGGKTCSPTWGQSCVNAVASTCGQSCSPTWGASCVAKAGTLCSGGCDAAWDASCVDKVSTVCGAMCDGGASPGDCKAWSPGSTDSKCAGVDLTVGVPCTGTVPVCNRGKTTAPAGVKVYVYPGNSSHFPKCNPPAGSESAQCTVPTAIPPGDCVSITDANCAGGNSLNGNKTLMVNPTGAVAECHCENNWGDYHNGGCQTTTTSGYTALTYKQVYTSSCPEGTQVQWSYLTYDSVTPGDSNIVFQAHTAKTVAALPSALTLLATAKATPLPDTQVCPFAAGPAGCPISLFTAFGQANAVNPVLELVITINPTSNKASAPTLSSWKVTYSCPDSE